MERDMRVGVKGEVEDELEEERNNSKEVRVKKVVEVGAVEE